MQSCVQNITTVRYLLDLYIRHYIPREDWLPNSPDLSLIENVWSIVATAVYADPEPQSLH